MFSSVSWLCLQQLHHRSRMWRRSEVGSPTTEKQRSEWRVMLRCSTTSSNPTSPVWDQTPPSKSAMFDLNESSVPEPASEFGIICAVLTSILLNTCGISRLRRVALADLWRMLGERRDEKVPGYCERGLVFAQAAQDDVCSVNKLYLSNNTSQTSNWPNDTKQESTDKYKTQLADLYLPEDCITV